MRILRNFLKKVKNFYIDFFRKDIYGRNEEIIVKQNTNILFVVNLIMAVVLDSFFISSFSQETMIELKMTYGISGIIITSMFLWLVAERKRKNMDVTNIILQIVIFTWLSASTIAGVYYDPQQVPIITLATIIVVPFVFTIKSRHVFVYSVSTAIIFTLYANIVKIPFCELRIVDFVVLAVLGGGVGDFFHKSSFLISEEETRKAKAFAPDYLTGLLQSHAYIPYLAEKTDWHNTFAILIMDFDNFKLYNDEYGHEYGDEVIKLFATAVNNMLRDKWHEECLIRSSTAGDEFYVVLGGSNARRTIEMISDIKSTVHKIPVKKIDATDVRVNTEANLSRYKGKIETKTHLTVSGGYIIRNYRCPKDAEDFLTIQDFERLTSVEKFNEVKKLAEKQLQIAKRERNRFIGKEIWNLEEKKKENNT